MSYFLIRPCTYSITVQSVNLKIFIAAKKSQYLCGEIPITGLIFPYSTLVAFKQLLSSSSAVNVATTILWAI